MPVGGKGYTADLSRAMNTVYPAYGRTESSHRYDNYSTERTRAYFNDMSIKTNSLIAIH